MSKSGWKKVSAILSALLLTGGLLILGLYLNRKHFTPKITAIRNLHVAYGKDTVLVLAGIEVQNRLPFPFTIDSLNYQIRNSNTRLGWGKQIVSETLPANAKSILEFRLLIDKSLYKKQLKIHKNEKELKLEVQMQVYINPPFLDFQKIPLSMKLDAPIPKGPSLKVDSLVVQSFNPDSGYTFLLFLNTDSNPLPNTEIENLKYQIRLSDNLVIQGETDTTFFIKEGSAGTVVPIRVETAEIIELLSVKLSRKKKWPYSALISGLIKSESGLMGHTTFSIAKPGILDTRKIGSNFNARPQVIQLQRVQLITLKNNSHLNADVLVHNSSRLPLYIENVRYSIRSGGKTIASGGKKYNKIFPVNKNTPLSLALEINNKHYHDLIKKAQGKSKLPLWVEFHFTYSRRKGKPLQISVRKDFTLPVMPEPEFKVLDIGVKKFTSEKGAQLYIKLGVINHGKTAFWMQRFKYDLHVNEKIHISGTKPEEIKLDTGALEIEIPLEISAVDLNKLTKGLIEGKENWNYAFAGSATLSAQGSIISQTEASIKTQGIINFNSKGTPDYMPEISRVDTLQINIRYDTAWVNMYAAIYNTLPLELNIKGLNVKVIHKNDTVGHTEEKLNLVLKPDTNSLAWHTLGINYGKWEKHVLNAEREDSMLLQFPVIMDFELGNSGLQMAQLNLNTYIPKPEAPVFELTKTKLKGISLREGIKFNARLKIKNANAEGLSVKEINYKVILENGVIICGRLEGPYDFIIGDNEIEIPIALSFWDTAKMIKRQLFGPFKINYKLELKGRLRTNNLKLRDTFVEFSNHNITDLSVK